MDDAASGFHRVIRCRVREVEDGLEPGADLATQTSSGDRPVAGATSVENSAQLARTEALDEAHGASAPQAAPELAMGSVVGRYELVELLGSGGMGSVYRAHDPVLSRDIALKVLHQRQDDPVRGSGYRSRLLREAQGLAKLSHPNVVGAFDVGSHEGLSFVAMELVQGESLRSWRTPDRTLTELLRVLIAAGRGLVAAHTAGVMHRDFKPANVMVSPDGRVRVVDFGLARAASKGAFAADTPVPLEGAAAGPSLLGSDLTDPGVLMGTPGYIAPEQLRGEATDMQADQYSYAMTVFVILTGRRPHAGPIANVTSPTRPDPYDWPRNIPRRIRKVVERGLASQPSERYPRLVEMVDALEEAVTPRRRTSALWALALGGVLIAAGTAIVKARSHRVTCDLNPSAFQETWGEPVKSQLERAFLATGRPNAGEAFGLFAGRVDAFRDAWLAMKQASCEDTYVRGEQSEKVLGLRNVCLDRKRAGVAALIAAFSQPAAGAIDRAAGASPDPLAECADTAALLGVADKLPEDGKARAAVGDLESAFPTARALMMAGRWGEAIASATQLLERARAIGHAPTIAQAVSLLGRATYSGGRTADERKQAEVLLRESVRLAAQTGDDRLAARSSSFLVTLITTQNRIQEADAMLPSVEALVMRAGNEPFQRVEVLMAQARVLSQRRQYPEAMALFTEAIRVSAGLSNEEATNGAYAEANLGDIYLELDRYPEAVSHMEASLSILRRIFGSHHPRVIVGLANLGIAQSKAQLRDAAFATVAEMKQLVVTLAPDDWRAATIPFLEGQIWDDGGDCTRALPFYRDSLGRFEKIYGAADSHTADVHSRLGACLATVGERTQALEHLEAALEQRRADGAAANVLARVAFDLARVLGEGSRAERARALTLAEEARRLWLQDHVTDKLASVERWLAEHRPGRP